MPVTDMGDEPDPLAAARPQQRPGTRRAKPARRDATDAMIDACPDTPAGRRDAALVATMRAGLLRGIEAARLSWRDIDRQADGTALIELGAHKADPTGRRRQRFRVDAGTLALIDRMRPDAGSDPRLFRLSEGPPGGGSRGVAKRLRAAGLRAGVPDVSGHSIRRGGAHDVLTAPDGTIERLMLAGRWSSLNSAARYVSEIGGQLPTPDVLRTDRPEPEPEPEPRPPRHRGGLYWARRLAGLE